MGHVTVVAKDRDEACKRAEWQRIVYWSKANSRDRNHYGQYFRPASYATSYRCIGGIGPAYEVDIVSAHRTPEKLMDYGQNAHKRGIKAIIAGAGGAPPRYGGFR